MKLFIPKDMFDNPRPPRVFLCTTGKKIIGELPTYETSIDGKWNAYSEFSFSIDRQYTDVLTGETKVHPLFDKAEGLRKVYVENIGYFVIQDPDATYGDKDSKTLSCFSSEYETGSKYLENFRVNTGEIDSKEVLYLEGVYGENYTIDKDNLYALALSGKFDAYENYYIKEYSDSDSYVYTQIEIVNETSYQTHFGDGSNAGMPLYVKNYPNVRFYWPTKPELSLVHLILEKIPEWKIGNVDVALWRKERKFDEDRIAVYDFLMNEVSDTFNCVVEWDTITNTINFYEEAEDGITDDNTVQTRWDTDVYISRENLASEISISYSTDDIKTKLKVSGADDLEVREVNLGKNYIMNLGYYHTLDWMEQDLFEAYDDYLDTVELYTPQYTEAVHGWVAAYNKWNDLMNAVPAEGNVVLVGDMFEKLYCVYTPINTAYLPNTLTDTNINSVVSNLYSDEKCTIVIDKTSLSDKTTFVVQGYQYIYQLASQDFKCESNLTTANLSTLKEKLELYHVDEDIEANEPDNILLRLKNSDSDVATIRIYYDEGQSTYMIQKIVVRASSGLTDTPITYTLGQWIKGTLTADTMQLKDYTVSYIGIMGAYFVLAKDETIEDNIEDYGVNLLRTKHEVYTTIFQTQTEAMYSQEDYQCTASPNAPSEPVPENTRWFDTDSNPPTLYKRTNAPASASFNERWEDIETDANPADLENYQRYMDNYEKLQTVQTVLVKKEREAEYCLNGYAASNPERKIDMSKYTIGADGVFRDEDGQTLEGDMHRVAEAHFSGHTVVKRSFDSSLPLYTFTTSFDPIVYGADSGVFKQGVQYYVKSTANTANSIDVYTPVIINDKATYDSYEETLYVVTRGNVFAVYLKGTTPYVAYANSQGVYKAKQDYITNLTDFEGFFTEDQWIRLSPFIREDEYSDSNFLLTSYESEEERFKIYEELLEAANKELNTLCQPSLEFSMNMANILALLEFKSLTSQFQLGNFVRVHVRDGYLKRARLLEVHLNFDDLSDFSCSFGNLITTKSEIDKHAELLAQAMTAGKKVATSAGDWQTAVDKANKLEESIVNGLQDAALQIGRASGQAITWDERGFFCRKFVEGSTDTYLDEQIAIINNKIVFTNDGWKTSKAALGEFEVDTNGDGRKEKLYGLLADAVVSGYISGSTIEGGSLKIGDGSNNYFEVSEDGSVTIYQAGQEKYATSEAVDIISEGRRFSTELVYTGSTIFSEPNSTCTITCKIYDWDEDVTQDVLDIGGTFSWIRNSTSTSDTTWNTNHANRTTNTITITNEDVAKNSHFECEVNFDPDKLKKEGET